MVKTKVSFKMMVIILMSALVLLGGGGAFYLFSPVQYLALDVNPSMELHTNRMKRVVSMKALNEDARLLLADYKTGGKKLDLVLEQLVQRMVESGYIADSKVNNILLTSEKDSKSKQTLRSAGETVKQELTKHALSGEIVMQSIALDESVQKEAAKQQISAGKMTMIEQLLAEDASLTAEALAGVGISELLVYAEKNKIPLTDLENHLEMLQSNAGTNSHLESLEEAVDDQKDGLNGAAEEAADKKSDEADQKADAEEEIRDAKDQEAERQEEAAEKQKDVQEEAAQVQKDAEEKVQEEQKETAEKAQEKQKEEAERQEQEQQEQQERELQEQQERKEQQERQEQEQQERQEQEQQERQEQEQQEQEQQEQEQQEQEQQEREEREQQEQEQQEVEQEDAGQDDSAED